MVKRCARCSGAGGLTQGSLGWRGSTPAAASTTDLALVLNQAKALALCLQSTSPARPRLPSPGRPELPPGRSKTKLHACTHLEMFGVRFHPKFSKIQQKHRSWRQGSKESKEAPRSAWSERPVRATRGREANHLRPPWPAASSAALDTPPVGEASRVPFFLTAHARVGRAEPQQEAARQTEQARSETARLALAENEGGNDSAGG